MKVLLSLILLFAVTTVTGAEIPDFPYVMATGYAEKEVPPDMATIHLNFLAFHKSSDAAVNQLNKATDTLAVVMAKYKIPSNKLDARDIRKNIKRQRDRSYESLEILGYELSRSMTLTLDNISVYPKLIEELASIDNLTNINSDFDTQQRKSFESDLMALAGKAAREKAEAMAVGLGSKIQSVYGISSDAQYGRPEAKFEMRRSALAMESEQPETNMMLVPESIKLSQTISVIFRIK
ncbi:hypothetical protein P886_0478 [Alteromonadaceae bacterium 2753L.S.0a.02]|nr:hypothetical protein P886_0478 [Alteromonadaceae bacterium 2753L.S.0a.02]